MGSPAGRGLSVAEDCHIKRKHKKSRFWVLALHSIHVLCSTRHPCLRARKKKIIRSLLFFYECKSISSQYLCHGCFYGWPEGWSELQRQGHFGEFNLLLRHCGHSVCQQKHPRGLCRSFSLRPPSLTLFLCYLQHNSCTKSDSGFLPIHYTGSNSVYNV